MSRGSHYDGKIAGLYDLGDTLGRGHFAVVKLAKHVFTGEQVAVKVIDKTRLDEVSRSHLFQEVRCMKLVQHPNVVRLYDVIDTQTKLYLILELGDGGDMYDYILRHDNGVDEEVAKRYFKQIVHAISYCHKLHVVHRDLKPENVVFFERLGMVKLTDFGFSNKFCPGQKLETSCGSLAYSAPEILLGDSYDAPKVDVWSLGVILYMLVCGRAPFQEANDSETLTMIMDCKYIVPHHISDECKQLIGEMLIRDPDKRATLEEIANNDWLNSGDPVQPADHLPLVSREHMSEDDHTHIVQKMVNGNIASKEGIMEALDKNEYNHITATYYLLAERKLRGQRQERAQMINSRISRADLSPVALTPSVSSAVPSPAQEKPCSFEGLLSPCIPSMTLQVHDFVPRFGIGEVSGIPFQRKCSIVREEEDASSTASGASSPAKSPTIESRSLRDQLAKLEEEIENVPVSDESVAISIEAKETCTVSSRRVSDSGSGLLRQVDNDCSLSRNVNSPDSAMSPSRPVLSLPVPDHSQLTLGQVRQGKVMGPNRRLHSVQSSPQLPLSEISHEETDCIERTSAKLSAVRKKYVGKLQLRSSAISQVMKKRLEQHKSDKSNGTLHEKVPQAKSPKHEPVQWKVNSHQAKKAFHSVYSTESTDSLDFLNEDQPRLMNSISCGDLSADTSHYTAPQQKASIARSDSISLTDLPQLVTEEITEDKRTRHKPFVDSSFNRYTTSMGNSVSLNSGLSSLQKHKLNLKGSDHHRSQPDKISDKNGRISSLSRLGRSANRQRLDINQNGWRKSKKDLTSSGNGGKDDQAVVDMKLASKCCILC